MNNLEASVSTETLSDSRGHNGVHSKLRYCFAAVRDACINCGGSLQEPDEEQKPGEYFDADCVAAR
ncbi:Uncharacterised protein [Dermatophilus congolensis]|uniref:Uncharacterized protein n=1 Tax=Dermatophilus congolensis TaxID=1863 RepID=A0A239VD23_9MICO|nr:Uncharacterised protein [Dermatophilus congolensis]